MNPSAALALGIVSAILALTGAIALVAVRRVRMDPQQFLVGGRSFGTLLLWVLMAGEIYTSFTFLGAAGWAYGLGAPAFYILAYGTCGYTIGYFLLPAIWQVAKERGLLTAPDFFADRYRSRGLGIAIALVQFTLVIPYVTLQLSGLRLILTMAGYGSVDSTVAVGSAFVLMALFVLIAGLRGTAWASVVKDILIVGAVLFAGIAIPVRFFGSPAQMFDRLIATHPAMLTLASGAATHGTLWYVSTVLLTAIGFYMGAHSFNATYSARSGDALRRNAMLLPLYQLVLLLVFFAGFAALLIVPGLHGTAVDRSFLLVVQRYYPPWVMGTIAGAGCLAALVPASALILANAGVFVKNVLGDGFGIATGERARTFAIRILVLVVAFAALLYWFDARQTLVQMLLVFYDGNTQIAPAVFAAFLWKRATAWGVAAGIAGGLSVALYLNGDPAFLHGINAGFVGLAVNVALLIAVSLLTQRANGPGDAGSAAVNSKALR